MADNELGELYGPVGKPRAAVSAWLGLAGAATSMVLVGGIAVWGYQLMMRDVNGIPVVRALEGPMRVAPKDPGGERMAHQGLAVNQVAAAGEAGEIADTLTLAPPAPALLDQDLARATLVAQPVPDLSDATDDAVLAALEDAGATEAADAGLVDTAVAGAETVAAVSGTIKVIPTSVAGVKQSPRPTPRPARMIRPAGAPEATLASAEATVEAETVEVTADSLPVGSRLVQLGAFESRDLARAEWARMAAKFDGVMAGKARVIQEASSGGKTFYRLRVAGFQDLADARRFCATLVADKSKPLCVPVATR